jgi:FKBP-type peptidyl-prolyl cis-trans isomerase SlpA
MRIAEGARVTLHFRLCLADGQEIDGTRDGAPATFVMGDGSLPEGFEQALFGLEAGANERLDMPPEQAFGLSREENVLLMPVEKFDPGIDLEPGVVVAFSGPDGDRPGVIRALQGALVVVDFNHPLASKCLILDVSILSVEAADDTDPLRWV